MESTDFSQLRQSRLALEARHEEARRSYDALRDRVLEHQARIAWQPEVKAVLETLQKREHERAVGAYEQLLTALLQDVLPGPREVVMDLYSHGGLPALDISLRKGQGQPLEDVLHGTGGSVANVVSAGLRAIALLRSGKRKFLVLDEADCWIKPLWAPRFAEVIEQLSTQMGVQVLMISHHEESLFSALPHRVRLEKHAQGLSAQWSPDSEVPRWEPDQHGIRSITLEDFQAHSLTHVPLGPGVTLLCGDNDIGKSAIVTALRSVFLGEANDTVVRHHQKAARITIDFGPEHLLRWERHSKGKIKESYRHYSEEGGIDQPIHASNGAKAVPDWVEQAFGIGLIDGLDVQIGHQKDPIFLLNKPSTLRAKALAIGQDAGHVQAMMAIDKREGSESKASIKQGEQQLERLSRIVQSTGAMAARRAAWEQLEEELARAEDRRARLARVAALRLRWLAALDRQQCLDGLGQSFGLRVPVLRVQQGLRQLEHRWARARNTLASARGLDQPYRGTAPVLSTPPLAALQRRWKGALARTLAASQLLASPASLPPQTRPTAQWKALGARWRGALQRMKALERPLALPPMDVPEPPSHGSLRSLAQRWGQAMAMAARAAADLDQVRAEEEAIGHDSATCPQCGQAWSPG